MHHFTSIYAQSCTHNSSQQTYGSGISWHDLLINLHMWIRFPRTRDYGVSQYAKTVIRGRHILKEILVNITRNIVTDGRIAHPTGLLAALLKKPTNVANTKEFRDPTSGWQSRTMREPKYWSTLPDQQAVSTFRQWNIALFHKPQNWFRISING